MDRDGQLLAVTVALAVVVVAWTVREVVGWSRRRQERTEEVERPSTVTTELVPLLLQPVAALVKSIGRNRRSIESLVGDDGTVSLLFGDIERSTDINRRLGDDEWVRVLRAHDEVVERVVRRHKGQVVKTQGDGFMAAFRTPDGALHAAVALGPALDAAEEIDVPLAVRIGVHTGPVVAESGDLFGTNVAMAARIAAEAHGGQVLVSDAVRLELEGDDELAFHRRRARRLKGLPGRHRLYAVDAA